MKKTLHELKEYFAESEKKHYAEYEKNLLADFQDRENLEKQIGDYIKDKVNYIQYENDGQPRKRSEFDQKMIKVLETMMIYFIDNENQKIEFRNRIGLERG